MSDSWQHTRSSVRRLKEAWEAADEDARYGLMFWAIGLAMMAGAIIDQFGWPGAAFCTGLVVWRASGSTK